MAVTIATIAAALNVLHASTYQRAFRTDSAVLNLIPFVEAPAGKNLVWSVKFDARTAGGAVADGADMESADFDTHDIRDANLPWAIYRSGVKINDGAHDISAQQNNGFDLTLFQDEADDALGKIRNDMSAHAFSGNPGASPAQLGGLARVVDDGEDNYAGILNGSGQAEDWAGHVGSLNEGSYTLSELHREVIRPIINATGKRPDFILADTDEFDYIADLVDSNSETMQQMIASGPYGFIQSQVGTRIVIAKGVPVIEDRHCTTKNLYGITRASIRFRYIRVARPAVTPAEVAVAVKMLTGHLPPEAEVVERMHVTESAFGPVLVPLDKTGLSSKLMLRTPLVQLEARRRDAHSRAVVS